MSKSTESIALSVDIIRPQFEFNRATAAAYLGLTVKQFDRMRQRVGFPEYKPGKYVLFKREWLDAYIESTTRGWAE